ncbi:MAG TPA: FliH/SctL family protein [Tepidisphaeraceae bacterium]|nr:FliH/SctL family protein [Tepidisphaeraceae bacterium]
MGLIKSANAPVAMIPFSMKDIETQARALMNRAKERAEGLLIEAQKEAENLKAAAKVEGLVEGKREGLVKGLEEGRKSGAQQALSEHRTQLANLTKALTEAAADLDASRQQLQAEALMEVIDLSVAIAQRVTKRQGLIDPQVLTANLNEAMKLVVASADVRIALHPSQKQYFLDALPQLALVWPALQHVQLVEDDTLAPGGCRVFSRGGQIDADLDGQLDRVIADLMPGDGLRSADCALRNEKFPASPDPQSEICNPQ